MVSPDVPHPNHGFELAAIAFFLYVVVTAGPIYGLVRFGFPIELAAFAFLPIAALRLKSFVPVFRRLVPDGPDVE